MANNNRKSALLWKTEDWLAVWWIPHYYYDPLPASHSSAEVQVATDGEFASYSKETAPAWKTGCCCR